MDITWERKLVVKAIFRTVDSCTCRLHTDTIHRVIAVSSLPFAININIDARSLPAWFIFSPSTKDHMPAIDKSEIAAGLKAKQ